MTYAMIDWYSRDKSSLRSATSSLQVRPDSAMKPPGACDVCDGRTPTGYMLQLLCRPSMSSDDDQQQWRGNQRRQPIPTPGLVFPRHANSIDEGMPPPRAADKPPRVMVRRG